MTNRDKIYNIKIMTIKQKLDLQVSFFVYNVKSQKDFVTMIFGIRTDAEKWKCKYDRLLTFFIILKANQGRRERSPATKNYVPEIFLFGILAGVNRPDVQWNGLVLEEPPRWSRLTSTPSKYSDSRRVTD